MIDRTTLTPSSTQASVNELADRAAEQAEQVLKGTRRATNQAIDRLQQGVDTLQDDASGGLKRVVEKVDDLAHRGLERARYLSAEARERAAHASDSTVAYIRDQPVKSVLIAAAAGAGIAALLGLLRQRRDHRL
jgi:ElaB/YqjD/DUF883 family membrane-anchored ribosome-binding protein